MEKMDLFHADEVLTLAGIDALNMQLFSHFFQKVYKEVLPESNLERVQILENMNLVRDDRLNLAGLLLFGKKPQIYKPEFTVKAVYFSGIKTTDSHISNEEFEGSLFEIFQSSRFFIMRHLKKVQGKKGVNTTGDPEIPESVFKELLVNALIHRDYFITAPIRLFVFEDRIEIISPGCLPNQLTVEKIVAGNSVQRNPILASFAAKGLLPYRGLGTGVRRALQDWSKIEFIDNRDECTFTSIMFRDRV